MAQEWHDLLFAHWPVPAEVLRPLVPPELEIEEFDGTGWLGIVPFRLRDLWRRVPGRRLKLSFLELNVRTYVRVADRPGVFFSAWMPPVRSRWRAHGSFSACRTIRRG